MLMRGAAGRNPTGDDRKHDDDPEPNPSTVCKVIFSVEFDHITQSPLQDGMGKV